MLPFVTIRKPLPYDTTLLNYNWQIWGCKAFSLYAGQTNYVEDSTSMQSVEAGTRHPLSYYKGRGELREEKSEELRRYLFVQYERQYGRLLR